MTNTNNSSNNNTTTTVIIDSDDFADIQRILLASGKLLVKSKNDEQSQASYNAVGIKNPTLDDKIATMLEIDIEEEEFLNIIGNAFDLTPARLIDGKPSEETIDGVKKFFADIDNLKAKFGIE